MVYASLAAHKPPPSGSATDTARPSPAAAATTTTPVVKRGDEPGVQVYDFENLSADNRAKATQEVCVKYLNATMIDPCKDCIVQSPYKSAKTTMTHDYITQNKLSVLSIVNLRSLKDGFVEKFADCDVLSYDDPKFREKFTAGRSVVITLDSLCKLEAVDFQAKDYVVFWTRFIRSWSTWPALPPSRINGFLSGLSSRASSRTANKSLPWIMTYVMSPSTSSSRRSNATARTNSW
jgi:hypothetical protein